MKKEFKKLIAMLLTITLLTSLFPAVLASGEGTDETVDLGRPIISTEDKDSTGESGPQHSDQVLPEDTAESTDETVDLGRPIISTEDKDSTGESGPQHSDQVLPEDTTESTDSGNTCAHKNTEIAWDTNYSITYTSVSNTQHSVKGYQYRYCTSCFKHVGDSFAVTEQENHTLDKSGDCTLCEYTGSCKHTNTKYVIIDGFPAYKCHNEKEHIVDTQYKEVCKNCGKVIQKVVDSKRTYVHEKHQFDSDGICSGCKYVKPEEQIPLSVSVSAGQYSTGGGTRISATASATGGDGYYSFGWKVTYNGVLLAETDMGYGSRYDYAANQEGSYVFAVTVRDGSRNTATAQSSITVEHIHDYKTVSSKKLINQNTTFHNVETTTYKECSICHQKTDPVVETVPEKHAAQRQSYESEHPHKLFFVCKCGAHPYVEGEYKTANGKVQEAAACCICHGHQYGEAVEVRTGKWEKTCASCGMIEKAQAPVQPAEPETEATAPITDTTEKQELKDYNIAFIKKNSLGKNDIYTQFFNDELRAEIEELSEGWAATSYDFIDGDPSAHLYLSQATYYVDTLMKQCAQLEPNSNTINVSPDELGAICKVLGLEDTVINEIIKDWIVENHEDCILTADQFKDQMNKYEFNVAKWTMNTIDVGTFIWDCLSDLSVYNAALDGSASRMIDAAAVSLEKSDIGQAKMAAKYIESLKDSKKRIGYIIIKNAGIVEKLRDGFNGMEGGIPEWKIAFEAATTLNGGLFRTNDIIKSNHGTYWSLQLADELYEKLETSIAQYESVSSDENYTACMDAYSLYITYLISSYNGVLETRENYSSTLIAELFTSKEKKEKEKALNDQYKAILEWYECDLNTAINEFLIERRGGGFR